MTIATKNNNALSKGYQLLQQYRIQSILGDGEFDITYLAQDIELNIEVAIKEYFPQILVVRESGDYVQPKSQPDEKNFAWGLERFIQEGQTLATFAHPNIVRVLRYFKANHTAYIIMEHERGQTLLNFLKNRGTITENFIMTLLPPLLSGLQAIHEAGFLHHDINPKSIYLRDKDHTPILLDFGATRHALGDLFRNCQTVVTNGYAPFEQYQIKGPQGPWTDIYALGAVLYRVVSGKIPVNVLDRINAIKRRKENDPLVSARKASNNKYSKRLLKCIDWALQIAEEDRPQTVSLWATALLHRYQKQLKLIKLPKFSPPSNKQKNWLVLAGVILVIGLNIGYIFYSEQRLTQLQRQQTDKLQQTAAVTLQQSFAKIQQQLENTRQLNLTQQQQLIQLQSEHTRLQQNLNLTHKELEHSQKFIKKAKQPGNIVIDYLQNGGYGPEMVWLPAGQFLMGDIQNDGSRNEQPIHWVSLARFAIGRYEVTFAEYDNFAEATGRKKPADNGWGRGKRPVINVSWYDAIAYAQWLSQQTGQQYRLPTEAEWEYAARAFTKTRYWWGNEMSFNIAHCENCGSEWGKKTAPVGSFTANPFGLHDMAGNVREWTCSKYEEKYDGKEQHCLSRQNSDSYRVKRGGSWNNLPKHIRVSSRNGSHPQSRYINVGFRLVKEDL